MYYTGREKSFMQEVHSELTRLQTELLLDRHRAALREAGALARLMSELALLGFLVLGAVTGLVFSQRAALPPTLSWGAPLIFLVIFAAWIGIAAQQVAAAWQGHILAAQARKLAGETLPLETPRDLLNAWQASWKLRLLVATPGILAAALYVVVLLLGAWPIYQLNHTQAVAYWVVFLLLSAVELAALVGTVRDLPRYYASLFQAVRRAEGMGSSLDGLPTLARPGILEGLRPLGRWLVPLPGALLGEGWSFWAGFVSVPLLGMGLLANRVDVLNTLLRPESDWLLPGKVPAAAIIALGLVWFFFAGLMLQQAGALWDALRQGERPLPRPWVQIGVRWVLALLPAWWLGGAPLLTLFLVYSLYKIICLLLVTQRGDRMPVLVLLVQAGGLPILFLAGALVWGVPDWAMALYQALAVTFYFLALASGAASWQSRAQRRLEESKALLPGDSYFILHATFWHQAGLLAGLLTTFTLFVFEALAERCAFAATSFLGTSFATCKVGGGILYNNVGLGNGLLVGIDLLGLMLVLGMLLAWLVSRLGLARQGRLLAALNRLRMVLIAFFFLLALAAIILALRESRPGWMIASLLSIIWGLLFL